MTEDKLKKLLIIIKSINVRSWDMICELVSNIENNKSIEILSKKWNDKYRNDHPEYYPLDLSKIKTWSIYQRLKHGVFMINVII